MNGAPFSSDRTNSMIVRYHLSIRRLQKWLLFRWSSFVTALVSIYQYHMETRMRVRVLFPTKESVRFLVLWVEFSSH